MLRKAKNSWKFVYILAKQCRSHFNLTNIFDKNFKILISRRFSLKLVGTPCIFCCNKLKTCELKNLESLVKHRTISPNLVTSQVVRGMEVAWSFCSLSRLCYQLPGGKTFMKPTLELLLHVNFSFFFWACLYCSFRNKENNSRSS